MTAEEKLARLPQAQRCDDFCKGWFIDMETFEPTRCDACWNHVPDPLTDDEVAAMPEAQEARERCIKLAHDAEHGTCYGLFSPGGALTACASCRG